MRSSNIRTKLSLVFVLGILLFGYGSFGAFATPPTSPYTAGATLDPACTPGSTNCTVAVGGGLDEAYDFGGAGAGRTITVDSGAIELLIDNSTVGIHNALTLTDSNNPNSGLYFNRALISGQDYSWFGMSDDVTDQLNNAGAFQAYNHGDNSYAIGLFGPGGSQLSEITLGNDGSVRLDGAGSNQVIAGASGVSFTSDTLVQSQVNTGSSTTITQSDVSTIISSGQQSLELVNDDAGYTPVGPLAFAGTRFITGLSPYDSYNGMISAGGVGRPIMRVLGATNQGLVQVEQSTVSIEADLDTGSNNQTSTFWGNGGTPTIISTANSGSRSIIETLDPSSDAYSISGTNGTSTSSFSLNSDSSPFALVSVDDGTDISEITQNPDAIDFSINSSTVFEMNADGSFGNGPIGTSSFSFTPNYFGFSNVLAIANTSGGANMVVNATSSAGISAGTTSDSQNSVVLVYRGRASDAALQDGDNVGGYFWNGSDGSGGQAGAVNTAAISAYVDGVVSSDTVPMRLEFLTGSTNASLTERMAILPTGEVGIGTSGFSTGSSTGEILQVGNTSIVGDVARFTNSTGFCTIDPTTTTLNCTSDETLKKDITNLPNALDLITLLRPVTYRWNPQDEDAAVTPGFIAQEVEHVIPGIVSVDDSTGLRTLSTASLIPYLTKAIQELNTKLDLVSAGASTGAAVGELVASQLTVGSPDAPTGITLFDTETSEPYCVTVSDGELVSQSGKCGLQAETSFEPVINDTPQSSSGGTPSDEPVDSDTSIGAPAEDSVIDGSSSVSEAEPIVS